MSALRERYAQAVLEWAWAIDNAPALCGVCMGRASVLREQLGLGMNVLCADLRSAQHLLDNPHATTKGER